jgi:zinc protease
MRRSQRFVTLVALLACATLTPLAAAQPRASAPLPAGMAQVAGVEGITEYRLANGLQLLLVPDPSKPTTTVNLTVHVGSRHENYGETGMAHLLEHLVFKGTPTTKNAWAEFTRRGLRANGTTWLDRTNYFASFTADDENLNWYVGWLADAMVNSFIAKEDLQSEMTVVRNEMEMGENNPFRTVWQRAMSAMYDWHNYGKSTIGARADVENVDIARLQAFYRLHYQPDNATLIVAGRFDEAAVRARVAATFGALPRPPRALPGTYTLDPAQDGERVVNVRRVGGTPLVLMGHHVSPGAHADFAAALLLAQTLGDTPGGRLHKRLVEKQLAAGAFGFALATAEPGTLFTGVQLAPGQDIDKARVEMAAVLEGVAREPITAEELERARTQWLNSWEQGFTDPEAIGVQLSEAIALGDWRLYFLTRDQVRKVTLADINRVAQERLRADNRTVGLYRPLDKGAVPERAPAPARVDVAALVRDYKGDPNVALAEAFDATPANLERRTQASRPAGGLKVALLPKGTRGRAVEARLVLRYGELPSLRGLGAAPKMLAAVLNMGGGGLTRQQISDRFDRLRAQVGFSAEGQTLTVSVNTVREHLPATIELIGKLLREPALPPDGVDEVRRQWLASIESERREPGAVVANALDRHFSPYPKDDIRHVETFDEQEALVKAANVGQLRELHRRFYSAAHGEFTAVGDLDPAAVRRALDKAFGDWMQPAAGAQRFARVPRPPVEPGPLALTLATPDKQNANLMARVALPVNDTHAEHAALILANHILGGGGSSRLWRRIREAEGLSYDVRSFIQWNPFEAQSMWISTAIFAPANRARVEAAWRAEIERALREGFTQAELDEAKASQLNFRRLRRAQDDALAGEAAVNLYLGRSFARLAQVDEAIGKATLEQVNTAWRRHFDITKLAIAWGGDFKDAK